MRRRSKNWTVCNRFRKNARVVLYHGDALNLLRTLPDKSIKLVVTSPPYNIGKAYEKRTAIQDYLRDQETIIYELARVLRDDGSICWQVGTYTRKAEVVPLDILFYDLFIRRGLQLRNRIIWHYRHGLHASRRFSGRYETIMWFTKTDKYTFDLDSVRVPSRYPGKRHYKGPKKGKPSGNPNGKNPSDVWELLTEEWRSAFWDIPNVKANHPEKTIQPCQFPVELVERCVLALSKTGDVVLDPFAGVASTLIAAIKHDRRAIGSEKVSKYYKVALNRLRLLKTRRLQLRLLGTPVYQPTGREKVAQIPREWMKKKQK